jgi:hypothetical protein
LELDDLSQVNHAKLSAGPRVAVKYGLVYLEPQLGRIIIIITRGFCFVELTSSALNKVAPEAQNEATRNRRSQLLTAPRIDNADSGHAVARDAQLGAVEVFRN